MVEEPHELPEEQRVCLQCGAALSPSDTEDSEQIEIEVKAYRRQIRRRRYQRTCRCANCPRTMTAPAAPKLIPAEGKAGYRWWLWVFLGEDTVVFRLDPTRSHEVPEGHFSTDTRTVLMVDRYSAYKAMDQVKLGNVVLVFCGAHVRRDYVTVGKGWPQHKEWAWLGRIRALYHHDRRRRGTQVGSAEFTTADAELRQTVAAMQTQAVAELADPNLPTPCRKVLASLQEHWDGLTRFLDDPRIPLDNNASERRVRGAALGRKNYYGSGALWSGRLAATLFSLFATLNLAKINVRTGLTWYLKSCAETGGRVPPDINPFLAWKMSAEKRREMAIDPDDT